MIELEHVQYLKIERLYGGGVHVGDLLFPKERTSLIYEVTDIAVPKAHVMGNIQPLVELKANDDTTQVVTEGVFCIMTGERGIYYLAPWRSCRRVIPN